MISAMRINLTNLTPTAVIAAVITCLVSLPVSALAEYRIATVDINRIMNDSEESKVLKAKLDKLSLKAKNEIEGEKKKLENMQKKLQEQKVTAGSPEAEEYQKLAREFSRHVKDAEEELKREFVKSNQSLTEKTIRLVEEYAKRNNIDLVLDKSLKTRGPVLFGTPAVDITSEIIAELSKS